MEVHLKVISAEQPFPGSSLYVPNDGKAHPAVICLHGSEGGGNPHWKINAMLLAAHGYVALAYCYFGSGDKFGGARETLVNVELMEIHRAFKWLSNSEYGADKKIGLSGGSRGAELALLYASLASKEPSLMTVDAVAVHSPADFEGEDHWLSLLPANRRNELLIDFFGRTLS